MLVLRSLPPTHLKILLNEFFDALETIADWCENTADIVRAIAVREH